MEKITNYTSREEVQMHSKNVCEYAETVNRVWAAAIELLKTKYAGKQINKRFCNDLNALFEKEVLRLNDGRNIPLISVSIFERWGDKVLSVYLHKRDYQFHNRVCYFDKEVYGTEVTMYSKFFDREGHIITEKLLSAIERCVDSNRELIYRLQDAAKNYDKHMKAYEKAKRAFLDACGKINPMFVETDLRTYESNTVWRTDMETKLGTYKKTYNC